MHNVKSQFWSFDLVFSVIVFSVAVTILASEWFNINSQLSLAYSNNANLMQAQAQTAARALLTPGSPRNWEGMTNLTNSSSWNFGVGIGTGDGTHISQRKLAALMSMSSTDYYAAREALGITFQYYIEIYNSDVNVTIGRNPNDYGALSVYSATSSGYLNGNPATIRVLVWTNTSFGIG